MVRQGKCIFCAVAALLGGLALTTPADAGGFAVREQSVSAQGSSFAGSAAGYDLSSMFWNSAAAAAVPGFNSETHLSLVLPQTRIDVDSGVLIGFGDGSGDIADPALVPASYYNYQLTERLYLGLAINSFFGLTTKPDNSTYAGAVFLGRKNEIFTVNVNPTAAYKLTPNLTVGVGVQAQYIDVTLSNAAPNPAGPTVRREADDYAFGFTAGVLWEALPGTKLGLGYRSGIDHELEGSGKFPGAPALKISADIDLPDMVTFSLRQKLAERLTLLGTVEWTNWSKIDTLVIKSPTPQLNTALGLDWDDGWFYSAGLEYAYTPDWTLRFGLAWEESPVPDRTRGVFLPDADRFWASIGATHKVSERISMDFAYTHIWVDDAPICRTVTPLNGDCTPTPPATAIGIKGEGESEVDIFSVSFKYKWRPVAQLEPYK